MCSPRRRRHTLAVPPPSAAVTGAAYGYAGMGPYRGAQAQLLRVPWADANCIRLPGEPGDSYEDDFVLLADAFVTGWHATTLADVHAGDTVAVFGAGTIGLRDLITSGRARPGTIVTHHGTLDDAPELNQQFDKRENGVIKAVLHPCSTHDSGRSGSVGPSRMTIIRRRDEGYGGSSLFGHPGPTVCCRPKLAIGNPKLSRPFPLRR